MADAVSPLAPQGIPELPQIDVTEWPVTALAQVSAWPERREAVDDALTGAGLPPIPNPGCSIAVDGVLALDAGPGSAWLTGPDEGLFTRLTGLIPPESGAVTDLGHARVRLRVAGPRAGWVLAKGVMLDLHDAAFAPGRCALTRFHQIGIMLHRRDAEEWDLYAYRSFARSLLKSLIVAGGPDTPLTTG